MTSVAAWLGLPLVLHLVATGVGSLAERVARHPLPPSLLAPMGACLAVLVSLPVVQLDGPAVVTALLLAALALAGLVLSRGDLRARLLPGWPALAALAALALYLAPVVLSGSWTWLGYNFVNDTAIHLAMIDHVAEHGAAVAGGLPSTHDNAINGTLGTGYPLGTYGLLAALAWFVPVETAALYQPFIACLAALAAMALATLARAAGAGARAAAAIGLLAVGATITYQYALHGAIKEVALVLVLAVVAALAREALDARLHPGAVALVALCSAAGVGVFSAAAGAYTLALGVLVLLAVVVERARPSWKAVAIAAGAGVVAFAIAGLPIAADSLSFGTGAGSAFAENTGNPITPTVFGHLVRHLPIYEGLGVWFRDDYRYPLEAGLPRTSATILIVLAGVLVVVALVVELRRRRLAVVLALAPALLVYVIAAPRLAPYADAKLLVALSPMLVFAAAMGAWWVGRRSSVAGVLAAALLAGGVVVSDAIAYHHARLAPVDRLLALRDAAEHVPRGDRVLTAEWEELAKYFDGGRALNVGPEAYSPDKVKLRKPGPIFDRSFDLDQLTLEYVEQFPALLLRRSPLASSPPANFVRRYENAYYELWLREDAPRVLEHLPLPASGAGSDVPDCREVEAMARRAGAGQELLALGRPPLAVFDPAKPPARPRSWGDADVPGLLVPFSRARARGRVSLPVAGRYRVWVEGGGGRSSVVRVDGRVVGAARQINTPSQWLETGQATLSAGSHAVELSVPGGSLRPGDGFPGELGRVVLELDRASTRVSVAPSRARELCGRSWDWIERVEPG